MSTFRKDLYENSSDLTSEVYFVGDAEEMTVFIDVDSETTVSLQGSNAYGFRTTIAEDEWSTLTTIVSTTENDLLNIEPGFRWIRGIRESATSWPSLVIAGRNDAGR